MGLSISGQNIRTDHIPNPNLIIVTNEQMLAEMTFLLAYSYIIDHIILLSLT
jgi:hypothetical protein